MVGTEHLSAVLSDSQALRARLLRLVVATAYTQEYAAELLERLDLRSGRAMGDSTRARQLADACREFALRLRALSPEREQATESRDLDVRALSAVAFTHAPVAMTVADLGAPGGIEGERPRAVVINRAFADMLGYTCTPTAT